MTDPKPREHMIQVRMNEEEHRMVRSLAEEDGRSVSDVIRRLVVRAHQMAGGKGRKR